MVEKKGLKETLEVITAVEGLALDAIDALKDGIDFGDVEVLFKNLEPFKAALEGIDQIDDELKDLDIEEIKTLTSKGVELAFAIIAKVKELSKEKK